MGPTSKTPGVKFTMRKGASSWCPGPPSVMLGGEGRFRCCLRLGLGSLQHEDLAQRSCVESKVRESQPTRLQLWAAPRGHSAALRGLSLPAPQGRGRRRHGEPGEGV